MVILLWRLHKIYYCNLNFDADIHKSFSFPLPLSLTIKNICGDARVEGING